MRSIRAIIWLDILITLACVAILVSLVVPAVTWTKTRCGSPGTGALSQMRQLQIAIQSMELDNFSAGKAELDWTCSNRVPLSLQQLTNALVSGGYMTAREMRENISRSRGSPPITEQAFNIFAIANPTLATCFLSPPKTGRASLPQNYPASFSETPISRSLGEGATALCCNPNPSTTPEPSALAANLIISR